MQPRLLYLLTFALPAGCTANPANGGLRPGGLPPGIAFNERVETYRFPGVTRADIGQGIRSAPAKGGNQRFAGYFEWALSWQYQVQGNGSVCRISQATVVINAIVTLPEWMPLPDANPALVEEWKRYLTALATHEAGHREVVQAGAIRIQRALLELQPQECGFMQSAAQQVAQPLLAQITLDDRRYDETTRHGATQGAVWPADRQPAWLQQ